MSAIAIIIACLVFLGIGFMVGFLIAAYAHSNIMQRVISGRVFLHDDKYYRTIEVAKK